MSYDSQTNIANRHNFDTTFTAEYDNDQTAGIILTPTAGKRLKVVSIHISGDATSGRCRIYFPTSANTILVAYAGAGGVLAGDDECLLRGKINEPIRCTSTFGAVKRYFIAIDYKEE